MQTLKPRHTTSRLLRYPKLKGLAAAVKKAGRVAAEGLVAVAGQGTCCAVVEVNSETDFVAKNEPFQAFVNGVAKVAHDQNPANLDALLALPFPGTGRTVLEEQMHQVATIGENINVRRFARLTVPSGVVSSYVHGAGKIGVLVALTTTQADDRVATLARQLAMHVAAANPQYLERSQVPAAALERERDIYRVKVRESGNGVRSLPFRPGTPPGRARRRYGDYAELGIIGTMPTAGIMPTRFLA